MTKFCASCGTALAEGAAFCPSCGTPTAGAATPQPAGYTAPQPPAAGRGRGWVKWLLIGGGGLLALLCLCLVVGARLGRSDTAKTADPTTVAAPAPSTAGRPGQEDNGLPINIGGDNTQPGSSTAPMPPVGLPGAQAAQPNVVQGVVVDSAGKPMKGAAIRIFGVSDAGEKVGYDVKADASGRYSTKVASGVYSVRASANLTFEGRPWTLDLHPTDNDDTDLNSSNGIVKNFQLKLTGLPPRLADQAENSTAYYGAYIAVDFRQPKPAGGSWMDPDPTAYPDAYAVEFTFTPTGPLIDGSEGKTVVMTRKPRALRHSSGPLDETRYLYDIPIGSYKLTATMKMPDGGTKALKLRDAYSSEGAEQESMELHFKPSSIRGAELTQLVVIG